MKRAMIDIETLGKNPGCVILTIGAVMFGDERTGEWFYRKISINDCTRCGLTIDESTLQWWGEQDAEIRREAFSGTDKLCDTLVAFMLWLGDAEVWGNGAAFDLGILRAAYAKFNVNDPWKYSGERCYRTLRALSPIENDVLGDSLLPLVDPPDWWKSSGKHNALQDAAWQGYNAALMLKTMGLYDRKEA